MNKKILILSLILASVLVLSILPVYAGKGKGQNKQAFQFNGLAIPIPDYGDPSDDHAGPVWARPPDFGDYQRTFHARNCPHTMISWDINIMDVISIDSTCDLDFNWNTNMFTHRVTETFTLADGTIELSLVGRESFDIATFGGDGRFVGFGTGDYEGVKIVGTYTTGLNPDFTLGISYTGTIMGWD